MANSRRNSNNIFGIKFTGKRIILTILGIPLLSTGIYAASGNFYGNKVSNFTEAKKQLTTIYRYVENPVTFYCNCPIIYESKKKMVPDLDACGYIPGKQKSRAQRIEWEHIMPASWLGQHLQCWQDGGRKNCAEDKVFAEREGDMHNLVPAIGEINAVRSNYRYNEFHPEPKVREYGKCDFIVSNSKPKAVQPAPYTRGFIARATLYMSQRYDINLSKQQQQLMEMWNQKYPVTLHECRRNEMIKEIQGNDNPFITEKCKESNIK